LLGMIDAYEDIITHFGSPDNVEDHCKDKIKDMENRLHVVKYGCSKSEEEILEEHEDSRDPSDTSE